MRRVVVEESGDDPVSKVGDEVKSFGIKRKNVRYIKIVVEADSEDPGHQQRLDEVTLSKEMAEGDVEYGPIPKSERQIPLDSKQGRSKGTGGNAYRGTRVTGAIMPDTQRAKILRCIDGSWKTSRDIGLELDIDPDNASAYLSMEFKDHGHVKRRGSPPYEYSLDLDGKEALRFGEQQYEKNLEDEIELIR